METHRAKAALRSLDPAEAEEIILGRLAANFIILAQLKGWPGVLRFMHKVAMMYFVPQEAQKLHCVVSNTAEVVKGAA